MLFNNVDQLEVEGEGAGGANRFVEVKLFNQVKNRRFVEDLGLPFRGAHGAELTQEIH